MRAAIAIVLLTMACSKSENAGAEEAKKQAEAELAAKVAAGGTAKKISPPIPGNQKVACDQLIDLAVFQKSTEEVEPLTVREKKDDGDAAATCAIIRGGERPDQAKQAKILKEKGRLGTMPGDELCYVNAYCWTIEDAERFKAKCAQRKDTPDESMGTFACRQTVAVGADDVYVYSFFDEDTKCIIKVGAGPSNVDNEIVRKCAIAARDGITPAQIAVGGAAAKPSEPAPAADGSAATE